MILKKEIMMRSAIFISYAREDKDTVLKLRNEIHRRTGVLPWMDVSDIAPGTKFSDVIAQAIDGCGILVLAISRNSVVSRWIRKEVGYAVNHGKKIYPVHIDDAQLQGGLELLVSDIEHVDYKDEGQRESFFLDLSEFCAGKVKDDFDLESWMREAKRFYSEHQYRQALDLYRQCAEHGSVDAEFRFGVMLYNGEGVRGRHVKEALRVLWDAAMLGHARAQCYLGNIYEQGIFKKNRSYALKWYQAAAERGDVKARERLAVIARENSLPCKAFRLFKAIVFLGALLGTLIAIFVFLVKADMISLG